MCTPLVCYNGAQYREQRLGFLPKSAVRVIAGRPLTRMSKPFWVSMLCGVLFLMVGCASGGQGPTSQPVAAVTTASTVVSAPTSAPTVPVSPSATAGREPSPTVSFVASAVPTIAPATSTEVPASPTRAVVASPVATSTASPTIPATSTPRPAAATVTATLVPLTVPEIAATAVADAAGEECVASGPKPAKGFIGDPARGKVLFSERGCSSCHGDHAQGGVGPQLAGTTLSFQAVIHQLREPRGVMQRYLPKDQSDADECDVYIYVKGLKRSP